MSKTKKPAVAIYVRYQSRPDLQAPGRQLQICQAMARAQGLSVSRRYVDVDQSRDGRAEMLDAARRGEFGVLVVEDIDRLARDMGEARTIHERLARHGVRIVAPNAERPKSGRNASRKR